LTKEKQNRSLALAETDEKAILLCRRIFTHCVRTVQHVKFMDLSYTEEGHQTMFSEIVSTAPNCFRKFFVFVDQLDLGLKLDVWLFEKKSEISGVLSFHSSL
jgi:hypothetical protein